jgi:hypothetical protein
MPCTATYDPFAVLILGKARGMFISVRTAVPHACKRTHMHEACTCADVQHAHPFLHTHLPATEPVLVGAVQ